MGFAKQVLRGKKETSASRSHQSHSWRLQTEHPSLALNWGANNIHKNYKNTYWEQRMFPSAASSLPSLFPCFTLPCAFSVLHSGTQGLQACAGKSGKRSRRKWRGIMIRKNLGWQSNQNVIKYTYIICQLFAVSQLGMHWHKKYCWF